MRNVEKEKEGERLGSSESKKKFATRALITISLLPLTFCLLPMYQQSSTMNYELYDLIIEGVSLVKNYRTQFREIIAKDSPEKLIEILRDKVNKS